VRHHATRDEETESGEEGKRVVGSGITTASPFPLPVVPYGQSSSHLVIHCTTTNSLYLLKACFVILIPVIHSFFSNSESHAL
jgi:hypothetical protein